MYDLCKCHKHHFSYTNLTTVYVEKQPVGWIDLCGALVWIARKQMGRWTGRLHDYNRKLLKTLWQFLLLPRCFQKPSAADASKYILFVIKVKPVCLMAPDNSRTTCFLFSFSGHFWNWFFSSYKTGIHGDRQSSVSWTSPETSLLSALDEIF